MTAGAVVVWLTERTWRSAVDVPPPLHLRMPPWCRLGPKSLGRYTRFVVDHAPCGVLVIWPDEVPGLASIPPPAAHPRQPRD